MASIPPIVRRGLGCVGWVNSIINVVLDVQLPSLVERHVGAIVCRLEDGKCDVAARAVLQRQWLGQVEVATAEQVSDLTGDTGKGVSDNFVRSGIELEGGEAGVGGEELAAEAEGFDGSAGVAGSEGDVVVCFVLREEDEVEWSGLVVVLG